MQRAERRHVAIQPDILAAALAAGASTLLMFTAWGIVEHVTAGHHEVAHVHFARGISTAFVSALAVGGLLLRRHRVRERALREAADNHAQRASDTRALLDLVVKNAPAGVILLDRECNVLQANPAAERAHGGPLLGRCAHWSDAADSPCQQCPVQETLRTGQPNALDHAFTEPRTGEILARETHLVTLPGREEHVLMIERVVTEQKMLMARLLHQEKMAAFGLFAAGIAHDMGNPLSSVEMHLQLLADAERNAQPNASLATVRQEVARLRRTLRELVDFARRRRDEAALVSIESVVRDALRLLRHERRMRAIQVEVRAEPETPAVCMVEDHLMQVVLNLILNAVDAMPDGGTLFIGVRPNAAGVELTVRDTGGGMEPWVLDRCREALFTTKPPGKGTGLGLSICQDIVQDAGGTLALQSEMGRGTTAVVALPAANPLAAA